MLILASACKTSPQAKEQAFMKRGLAQMAKKDYARAALEFRSAAQAVPADAEPYYQLGLAALGMGDANGAYRALRKAVELNPKHSAAQLKLAQLMVGSRQKELVEEAASNLRGVLAGSPDNPDALDTLAVAEAALGQTGAAQQRLEETLEKFPSHLATSVALAQLKLRQRDLSGAEEVLQKAAASAPQSAPAFLALAELYLLTRQPDKAETNLRKTLELEPKNAAALLDLGALQLNAKRTDEAGRTYQQLASLGDKRYRAVHATFLYRTGKRDEAVAELEKLATGDPDDRAVRRLLVRAYVDKKQTDKAQAVLAAALKRHPKDTDAMLEQAAIDLQSGQPSRAEAGLKQVLHLDPNSAAGHYGLAMVYRAQGSKRSENQELNDALRANPGFLPARLVLVRNFLDANQPKPAIQLCDEAPKQQKGALALVVERNWALLDAGETKELRAVLDQALRRIREPNLVLQDGVLRLNQHDYAGARASAEEVLRSLPENIRAANLLARSYADEGKPDKAIERLGELASARPQSAPLRFLVGQWQLRAGKRSEARQSFEAAKNITTNFAAADIALARLDIDDRQWDRARQRLAGLVTADPKNTAAWLMLARIEEQAGNAASAMEHYRAVLAVDSSNFEALNNLAYHLAAQNLDEALPLAQQAAEISQDNAAVQDTLGLIFYRKGDYKAALSSVKRAVDKEPTPRRQFHLAMCYLKTGDKDLGNKLLSAALQKDPNLPRTEQGW